MNLLRAAEGDGDIGNRAHSVPMWQSAVILLSGMVVGLGIVLCLIWGRPVLVPVALAVLMTFLLNPIARVLERRGLGRVLSVLVAVSASGICLICLGWLVAHQVAGMLAELPQNTANIKAKVQTLRELRAGPLADQFGKMFQEINRQSPRVSSGVESPETGRQTPESPKSATPLETIILRTESNPWLSVTGYLGSAVEVFATLAFTLVLLVAFLLGRNDLRDRVVLLGDEPALHANVGIYLRLMQGDDHEAVRLILQRMKDLPASDVFDEMLVPALSDTRRDVQREYLTDDDQRTVLRGIRECLRQSDEFLLKARSDNADQNENTPNRRLAIRREAIKPVRILGCPAMDQIDGLGLQLLRQLLDPTRWILEVTAVETLTSELVALVLKDPPDIICIASLPPGGRAHARYICKRLRVASPRIQIIVGRWGQPRNSRIDRERLEEAGATFVTTTLLETCQLLESRWPLLTKEFPTALQSAATDGAADAGLALSEPNA